MLAQISEQLNTMAQQIILLQRILQTTLSDSNTVSPMVYPAQIMLETILNIKQNTILFCQQVFNSELSNTPKKLVNLSEPYKDYPKFRTESPEEFLDF